MKENMRIARVNNEEIPKISEKCWGGGGAPEEGGRKL